MRLALLLAFLLVQGQEDDPILATPYDRVIELEITADDPMLIEGKGPTKVVEYQVEFSGTLHIWTRSELDLYLRVDESRTWTTLAEGVGSGTQTTYVRVEVERSDMLAVLVAGREVETFGLLELCFVAAPETRETLAAAASVQGVLVDVAILRDSGDSTAARERLATLDRRLRGTAGETHSQRIADVLWDVGYVARELGNLSDTRAAWSRLLGHHERMLPEDHPDLLRVKEGLAVTIRKMGDLQGARRLQEEVLAVRERVLPEDHQHLLGARANLANTLSKMGELSDARALQEAVLVACERTFSEDHPDLRGARTNLAATLHEMGDLHGAITLKKAALATCERTLSEDHPALLLARQNLGITMLAIGDLAGAHELLDAVVVARERTLPADHPDLLAALTNLGVTTSAMGDLHEAHRLFSAALAGYVRTMPADHHALLRARQDLAAMMWRLGDLPAARALDEEVLAACERTLPTDHPQVLAAREALAVKMFEMGDLPGARALQEELLATYERTLPTDHPSLLRTRQNLANVKRDGGDLLGARALNEAVLASRNRTLPEDHPDHLGTRMNLAVTVRMQGDLQSARALEEAVLATLERTLPEGHPDLLSARMNLAVTLCEMGDLQSARPLGEQVLASFERDLPADHRNLLAARVNLALTMIAMGDLPAAQTLLPALTAGIRARVLASLALAPRESRQVVGAENDGLALALLLSRTKRSEVQADVFEVVETMRLVAGEAARTLRVSSTDTELAPILNEATSVRRELNDLVAGTSQKDIGAEELSAEITRLSLERDRLERKVARRLAAEGVVADAIEIERLARSLADHDAAVGFRRMAKWYVDGESGRVKIGADHVMAHVLRADGCLSRVDLGPASQLEWLTTAWRAALGAPLLRGVELTLDQEETEVKLGGRLRARVLDPILAAAGEDVHRLHVCADDLVFLIPLDALPMSREGDARIGDRVQILSEVSFAQLLAPVPPIEATNSLLVLGGVDYDAEGSSPVKLVGSSAPIDESDSAGGMSIVETGDANGGTRGSLPSRFPKLLQSRYEAEATAALFEEAFETEPILLTRKQTTKAALFEAAAGKRYVHLGTHGWFAPETVRSTEDAQPEEQGLARMGIEERVSGLAPMTLCGLALAGANLGRDLLCRVPGILTAEELCSLDLSQCELAVLSACETNVGIRRAGQGIQSLQAALYAAGARSSITSLWKVDDAATRKLMEHFYTNLWVEKMGKADALWQAKVTMREAGHPVRDWAGWVLTGDPD